MSINNLPDKLLLKIFRFLPNAKNVSLVSSRFHAIAIEVHADQYTLCLDRFLFTKNNRPRLESIKTTKRKISKGEINLMKEHWPQYINIVKRFLTNIKYLEVTGRMDLGDFLSLLALVPNVLHLTLKDVSFYERMESRHHPFNVPRNVKTLEIFFFKEELLKILYKLPPGVLTGLDLEFNFSLSTLIKKRVFERQKNIKNLRFRDTRLKDIRRSDHNPSSSLAKILKALTLESLEYSAEHFDATMAVSNIATLFSRQTKLKSLKLDKLFLDDLMPIVPHLTELETLSLYVYPLSPAFVNIEKLVNLKHLTLIDATSDLLNVFTELDNSRITTLEFFNIYRRWALTVSQIRALATSAPKIKSLTVTGSWSRETVVAVFENFNFVEGIKLHGLCNSSAISQNSSSENNSFNPKLTELSLDFDCNTSFLRKINADYPNLKSLHTSSDSPGFRFIVVSFKNLETLRIWDAYKLIGDDIVYLRDHKKNLKCLYLESVSLSIVSEQMKTLESIFGAVKVFSNGSSSLDNILMGVDYETMKRWAKQIKVYFD